MKHARYSSRDSRGGLACQFAERSLLINLIAGHLTGNGLEEIWSRLDDIQRAAVAETIYSPNLRFDETRFKAKFGRLPSFGEERFYYYANSKDGPTLTRLLLPPHECPTNLQLV